MNAKADVNVKGSGSDWSMLCRKGLRAIQTSSMNMVKENRKQVTEDLGDLTMETCVKASMDWGTGPLDVRAVKDCIDGDPRFRKGTGYDDVQQVGVHLSFYRQSGSKHYARLRLPLVKN